MADRSAQALWYVAPRQAEIRPEPVGVVLAGDVRVRTICSALSRGTERLVFAGRVPESEYQRMRAPFMAGEFPFPVKYGYSLVGTVEAGPPELVGRTVFVLHPHQTVFTVGADAVIPVPDRVPPTRAVLAANMETALNAVWDGGPGPGDRVAVVGAGTLGALVAWLVGCIPGTQVTLVDVEPARRALATALGVAFAEPGAGPQDCDLVVHASGTGAGLAAALDLAGVEATVLELSWFGIGDVAVPLGGAFHSRRLKLIASQVGGIAPTHRPRWTSRRRLATALDLLADARLDALVAPAVAFHDLPHKLEHILAPESAILCPVIGYP